MTNLWGSCLEPTVEDENTARLYTARARYDLGYRWIRHANAMQGWAGLVDSNRTSVTDMLPDFSRQIPLWVQCNSDSTQALAWWCNLYSEGHLENWGPLYLHQIWHLDLYGPGGAGWTWVKGDELTDKDNNWTGSYFALTGIFADPVASGTIAGGTLKGDSLLVAWQNFAGRTAEVYGAQRDTLVSTNPDNAVQATFKRWMIFNEPFMRGLYPWNTVVLFRRAKQAIRAAGAPGTIYIGGTSGGKGLSVEEGGEPVQVEGNPHKWVTLSPLERHFALFAYGSGDTTGHLQNESLGVHIFQGGPPESRLLAGEGQTRNTGFLEKCNSIFSLGRFWGMDPVRVTVDEAALMTAPDGGPYTNPAETQANYVGRTLLLGLATGYLDAIHLAFRDHCKGDDSPADRPGIAAHGAVTSDHPEILKPGYYAATLHNQATWNAAYESSLDLDPEDPYLYGLRFRGITHPDTTITALWTANPKYDNFTDYDLSVTLQLGNDTPMRLYRRIPSEMTADPIGVCNPITELPADPGGIDTLEITSDDITYDPATGTYELSVNLSGAPIYLKSGTNWVRAARDRFSVTTLSGLKQVGKATSKNIYEITLIIEEQRSATDTLEIMLPSDWVAPSTDPDQPGYVSVGRASASLQEGSSNFDLSIEGHTVRIVPNTTLLPGCQFTILYGDYRARARLLDMGPWADGPVDLDFLKLENWMTADAAYHYERPKTVPVPDYTHPPRVGWGVAPNDSCVIGDDERKVHRKWKVPPTTIYRDHNGLAFADSVDLSDKSTQPLILRELEPNTEYDVLVYLNNPDIDFEECDPDSPDCWGKDLGNGYMLPVLTGQKVRVEGADATVWKDSTEDRLFRVSTDESGTLRVVFRHTGKDQRSHVLDNVVYCYGVEVHPVSLGAAPLVVNTNDMKSVFTYAVNGTPVASDTITVVADRLIPITADDNPE